MSKEKNGKRRVRFFKSKKVQIGGKRLYGRMGESGMKSHQLLLNKRQKVDTNLEILVEYSDYSMWWVKVDLSCDDWMGEE